MPEDRHPWEAQFVSNMAQRRKELGMTQAVLARRLSEQGLAFHQQTVQRIENGERPVRLNEAVLIVQALGLGDPGHLGIDSAIDPRLSVEIAHFVLEAAVDRSHQLMVAAELSRATAFDRVTEARARVVVSLAAYLRAADRDARDQNLVDRAVIEREFLTRYRSKLSELAQLHPLPRTEGDGEHQEAP